MDCDKFYGVCYRFDFPDGYFYIGSTKHWNENYFGSGGRMLKEHKNLYDKSQIKRTIIKDDFSNEEEMRSFEDSLINEYFYMKDGIKKRTEEGEYLLNYCSGNISKSFIMSSKITRNLNNIKLFN